MEVQIRRGESKNPLKRYYYVLVGANNEDMNMSQHYVTKWNCKRAATKLAAGIPGVEVVDTTVKPYKKYPSI